MALDSFGEKEATIGSLALAVGVGVGIAVGSNGIHAALTGRSLDIKQEILVYLFQGVLAAAPFIVLALRGVTAKAPWLTGVVLTIALWGYWIYDAVSMQTDGANIGLGLLLLISPVPITLVCLGVERVRRSNVRARIGPAQN
jgi:hypothetical protein